MALLITSEQNNHLNSCRKIAAMWSNKKLVRRKYKYPFSNRISAVFHAWKKHSQGLALACLSTDCQRTTVLPFSQDNVRRMVAKYLNFEVAALKSSNQEKHGILGWDSSGISSAAPYCLLRNHACLYKGRRLWLSLRLGGGDGLRPQYQNLIV